MHGRYKIVSVAIIVLFAAMTSWAIYELEGPLAADQTDQTPPHVNPLAGVRLYSDPERNVVQFSTDLRANGDSANTRLAERVSVQPSTTWLTGPSSGDTAAQSDINTVIRTSGAAAASNTVPVYELYAIPRRDACAGLSSGGFTTDQQYLDWVRRIIASLEGRAIFLIEADAVAHTINGCFSPADAAARYELLRTTTVLLRNSPLVLASYLDAGHSEWFPDPERLREPLKQSGVDNTNGVTVNVSYFIDNETIIPWSQRLARSLGTYSGVVIDTSRSGNGAQPKSVTGEARWCNPPGRAIGPAPTTRTNEERIDAYIWVKRVGESDGACFGHPSAGTFEPDAVLELSRNASY